MAAAVGTAIYHTHQASILKPKIQVIQAREGALREDFEELRRLYNEQAANLGALKNDNENLRGNLAELPKLRAEVSRLRGAEEELAATKAALDRQDEPAFLAMKEWLTRVSLLKSFRQPAGREIAEIMFLTEQDWLEETADRTLETEADVRKAMSSLRSTAKGRFAGKVNEALENYIVANDGQLPSDLSRLKPFLAPPLDSFLDGYEIAKPGWVKPPRPGSRNSERAETWALVEKGSFSPEGKPVYYAQDLPDPEYDLRTVIYRGGHFGYGNWPKAE